MRAQQSTAVLLSGPNGCGKRSAAEAIGYETGRPLKVMNYSRLMASSSRSASEAEESVVKAVFKVRRLRRLLNRFGDHFKFISHAKYRSAPPHTRRVIYATTCTKCTRADRALTGR